MTLDHLTRAQTTQLPSRDAMLRRDDSVRRFWHTNDALFREAWKAWEFSHAERLAPLDESLVDARLRTAVAEAWNDPTREDAVRSLWDEVAPGVFQSQLLDPTRIRDLRSYLEEVADAKIPVRPPYGIVLNRGGAMLDKRSAGYLAAPSFQAFYRSLLDTYMRPIARMLFPEVMGYDSQTFGFSIRYQPAKDTSIRPHTDASTVTLNINMNRPDEAFTGSKVRFYEASGKTHDFTFEPGVAVLHRGRVAHAAEPITSGERSNLVLWLYGQNGQLPPRYIPEETPDARQRWSHPTLAEDRYAPF
ncbi:MAG: 2OG-Fe(II) oxygenase [Myxococcota bacterium]